MAFVVCESWFWNDFHKGINQGLLIKALEFWKGVKIAPIKVFEKVRVRTILAQIEPILFWLGVCFGIQFRANWYENPRIWGERDEGTVLSLLNKWGSKLSYTIFSSLGIKDQFSFQQDSILALIINFPFFFGLAYFFTPISGLIMPEMIMQKWLCICIYETFRLNINESLFKNHS